MQAIVAFTSLLLLSGYVSGQNYRAGYFAGAPGDDPSTNGELLLYISEDNLGYRAALNNAIDVTGVHLHLQGNSSNGLFGGPLLLALTNTTVANGQAPVSSGPSTELAASTGESRESS
ncbi:hypothetical protein WJX73_000803 [Symbiochloris irregularis]|uniref:CHRD domain-containing protein n=1 Tax=Symbiochloris irregularis TaxID=706552 RepID=A0AAW1PVR6_9CHLO